MKPLFRDANAASASPRVLSPEGSVVCIAAFDGLHPGHQALVGRATARARELGLPAVALSFEPLPREFFARGEPPPRLQLQRAKFEGLRALGADLVGLLRPQPGWGRYWLRLGVACAVMAAVVLGLRLYIGDWTTMPSLLHRALLLLAVVAAGGIAYVLALLAMGLRPRDLRH